MGLAISLSEEAIYAEKNEQEPIKQAKGLFSKWRAKASVEASSKTDKSIWKRFELQRFVEREFVK